MAIRIFYGWWIVLACFFIGLYVGGVVFYGFTAFFEPIREEFGWSYTQISFAVSLRGLEMGLMAPLIGFLVDRFGSRKLILFGTFTVGLGLISLSITQSLAMFYGAFLLVAFGAGGCTVVVPMSTVANWFHKKVSIAMGVMASGIGFSGFFVPLIVWLIDGMDIFPMASHRLSQSQRSKLKARGWKLALKRRLRESPFCFCARRKRYG
jgi:MFS family permease